MKASRYDEWRLEKCTVMQASNEKVRPKRLALATIDRFDQWFFSPASGNMIEKNDTKSDE